MEGLGVPTELASAALVLPREHEATQTQLYTSCSLQTQVWLGN